MAQEVSRNLSQINDELSKINKSLRSSTRETNSLARSLRADPKNLKLAGIYADSLANKIDLARKKVELLNEKQKAMVAQNPTAKTTEEYRKLSVEIAKAESEVTVLNKKLNETKNIKLNNLQSEMQGVARVAKVILGSVVAIGTAFATMGDTIDKNSKRFNVSAESYQRWSYVFDQTLKNSGGYVSALEQMTRLMSQVERGTGKMVSGLETLGIELDALKGKNPQELLEFILAFLGSIEDEDERLQAAATVFSTQGNDLAQIAGLTREELAALNSEIEKAGIVTTEQAEKAAELSDSFNELKMTFKAALIDLGEKMVPTFKALIDVFKALIPILNVLATILNAIGPTGQMILLTLLAILAVLPKMAALIKSVTVLTAALDMTVGALMFKLMGIVIILVLIAKILSAIFGQSYELDVSTNADQLLGRTNSTIYQGSTTGGNQTTNNNVTYNDYSTTNVTAETEVDIDEIIDGLNSKVIQVGGSSK